MPVDSSKPLPGRPSRAARRRRPARSTAARVPARLGLRAPQLVHAATITMPATTKMPSATRSVVNDVQVGPNSSGPAVRASEADGQRQRQQARTRPERRRDSTTAEVERREWRRRAAGDAVHDHRASGRRPAPAGHRQAPARRRDDRSQAAGRDGRRGSLHRARLRVRRATRPILAQRYSRRSADRCRQSSRSSDCASASRSAATARRRRPTPAAAGCR